MYIYTYSPIELKYKYAILMCPTGCKYGIIIR